MHFSRAMTKWSESCLRPATFTETHRGAQDAPRDTSQPRDQAALTRDAKDEELLHERRDLPVRDEPGRKVGGVAGVQRMDHPGAFLANDGLSLEDSTISSPPYTHLNLPALHSQSPLHRSFFRDSAKVRHRATGHPCSIEEGSMGRGSKSSAGACIVCIEGCPASRKRATASAIECARNGDIAFLLSCSSSASTAHGDDEAPNTRDLAGPVPRAVWNMKLRRDGRRPRRVRSLRAAARRGTACRGGRSRLARGGCGRAPCTWRPT